jgi:hypothetical protein
VSARTATRSSIDGLVSALVREALAKIAVENGGPNLKQKIRRKIAFGERSLADATRRIAEIEQDLAKRTLTRGDAFGIRIGNRAFTERRAAGETLIALAGRQKCLKPGVSAPVGVIGGFSFELRRTYLDEVELRIIRTGKAETIECGKGVTPLGLISRLEYALSRFQVELAEERRTAAEISGWLPGFKARVGDLFPH